MLGENIRNLRKKNKISQEELAEKLNVSRQSISLWENDQTQPTIENIISLADVFGVSTDYLLKGEAEEETPARESIESSKKSILKKTSIICVSLIMILAVAGLSSYFVFKSGSLLKKENTAGYEQVKKEISSKSQEQIREAVKDGKYDFYYKIDNGKYKGTVHHRSCRLLTDSVRTHANAFPKAELAYKKGYKRCPECNCIK